MTDADLRNSWALLFRIAVREKCSYIESLYNLSKDDMYAKCRQLGKTTLLNEIALETMCKGGKVALVTMHEPHGQFGDLLLIPGLHYDSPLVCIPEWIDLIIVDEQYSIKLEGLVNYCESKHIPIIGFSIYN